MDNTALGKKIKAISVRFECTSISAVTFFFLFIWKVVDLYAGPGYAFSLLEPLMVKENLAAGNIQAINLELSS